MPEPVPKLHEGTRCRVLGNNVFFYDPVTTKLQQESNDDDDIPSLVILCTWLGGATTRRIAKYVSKYQTLFPGAAILLLRTTIADIALRTLSMVHSRLAPARAIIKDILASNNNLSSNPAKRSPSVLLHMFSNGGAHIGLQLLISLRNENIELPLRATIFDCSPGKGTFDNMYRAAAHSIPPGIGPLAHVAGLAALYPFVGSIFTMQYTGIKISLAEIRRQWNDPRTVLPTTVKRLYLYTTNDPMVSVDHVETHAAEARRNGYDVETVLFEDGASHCSLIRSDEARYAYAILDFWCRSSAPARSSSNNNSSSSSSSSSVGIGAGNHDNNNTEVASNTNVKADAVDGVESIPRSRVETSQQVPKIRSRL